MLFNKNYDFWAAGADYNLAVKQHGFKDYADWINKNAPIRLGGFSSTKYWVAKNRISAAAIITSPSVGSDKVVKKSVINGMDGSICSGPCGNFVPYAEANRPDGSYVCFNCR